jgi:hypothetical protein
MSWFLIYFVTVALPLPAQTAVTAPAQAEITTSRPVATRVMEFAFARQEQCEAALGRLRQSMRTPPNATCVSSSSWRTQKRHNHYVAVGPGEYPLVAP